MSCAWPDPEVGHRHAAEFCENGAKAVAEEATKVRATPAFFAAHPIAELDAQSEHWLGQQGRITHPMIKKPGGTHYEPISWEAAYALVADRLNGLSSPPPGCAAAYYPETNPLVPLDSTAVGSNTPTSKSVVIRLQRPGVADDSAGDGQDLVGADEVHKSRPEPKHLS